jgi:hypothetical protein
MAFESLVRELVTDPAVLRDIEELLVLKRRSGEQEWLSSRPLLNACLEGLMGELAQATAPTGEPDMTPLDDLLAETVLTSARQEGPGF